MNFFNDGLSLFNRLSAPRLECLTTAAGWSAVCCRRTAALSAQNSAYGAFCFTIFIWLLVFFFLRGWVGPTWQLNISLL